MNLKEDGSFTKNVGPEALALLAKVNGEAEAHEEHGQPLAEVTTPARRESSDGLVCAVCTEHLNGEIHRPAMGACEHVDTCALCYLRLRRLLGDQVSKGWEGREGEIEDRRKRIVSFWSTEVDLTFLLSLPPSLPPLFPELPHVQNPTRHRLHLRVPP